LSIEIVPVGSGVTAGTAAAKLGAGDVVVAVGGSADAAAVVGGDVMVVVVTGATVVVVGRLVGRVVVVTGVLGVVGATVVAGASVEDTGAGSGPAPATTVGHADKPTVATMSTEAMSPRGERCTWDDPPQKRPEPARWPRRAATVTRLNTPSTGS
jgi:hypothetical protein